MQKREVRQAPATGNCLAVFQRSEDCIRAKNSKVAWLKSNWISLNELCACEGVMFERRLDDESFALIVDRDESVATAIPDDKAANSLCRHEQLSQLSSCGNTQIGTDV